MTNLASLLTDDNPPKDHLPISPPDCALVVGIPLTKAEFLADCGNTDKLGCLAATMCSSIDFGKIESRREAAFDEYESSRKGVSFLKTLIRVCDQVQTLGVNVYRDVMADQLRDVFEKHSAVTILSHFSSPPIKGDDVSDVEAFLNKVRGPQFEHFVHRLVHNFISHEDAELLRPEILQSSFERQELKLRVASCLSSLLRYAETPYLSLASEKCDQPSSVNAILAWEAVPRAILEFAFGDEMEHAPSIEFRNSMATVVALKEQVPKEFPGTLDLSLCNSGVLGGVLKLARPRPQYGIVMKRFAADPELEQYVYQMTIESLAMGPMSYWDARMLAWDAVRRIEGTKK